MKQLNPGVAGIVLCGGQSSRMGRPKAELPFGRETLLQRTVRVLSEVVSPVLVVAADGQPLPELPDDVLMARDEFAALGPLAGLCTGMARLRRWSEQTDTPLHAAYATGCDVPFLSPAFVQVIIDRLGPAEIAVPREAEYHHPLAAVYRLELEPRIRKLLDAQQLRPLTLIKESQTETIDVDELRAADPDLRSLRNTNTPQQYAAALELAGLPVPDWIRELMQDSAP